MATSIRGKRPSADREYKTERMELRLAPLAKEPIRPHFACQVMILRGADKQAFLDALGDPPAPTDQLVAALNRHRERLG